MTAVGLVPLLACTECPAVWVASPVPWGPVEPTGCPACGAWSWLVARDTVGGLMPSSTRGREEEIR